MCDTHEGETEEDCNLSVRGPPDAVKLAEENLRLKYIMSC